MFDKATRKGKHIKLAIIGPSGSGKTYSALRLASGLTENGRIALIDTENDSASLYAADFDFDVENVEAPYEISKLVQLVKFVLTQDYDVLVIDSATHFWKGILEYKSKLDKRGGNNFSNWDEANVHYDLLLRAILFSKIHVIVCMRSKMEYVLQENEKGKSVPHKLGLAPIMRDGVEYEFTAVFDLDMNHQAMVSKDRTNMFRDKIFQISEDTGAEIKVWLNTCQEQSSVEHEIMALE